MIKESSHLENFTSTLNKMNYTIFSMEWAYEVEISSENCVSNAKFIEFASVKRFSSI